jgi:soluble lytic murein transglycosylase-like protein
MLLFMLRKLLAAGSVAGLALAGSAAGRIHVVRRGESLSGIARQYHVSVAALAASNGLADPNRIVAGAALTVPPPPSSPAPVAPAGALRDTIVPMPPAELAADRSAPRIVVPAPRAGLRISFLRFARLAGVPSDLAMALAWQESGWQRSKESSTGAVGVMQLEPDTVDFVSTYLLGLAKPLDAMDPVANIRMGTRFLRYLLDSQGGDVDRALASYYQGLRSVRQHGPLDETDRFVANVKALRGRF